MVVPEWIFRLGVPLYSSTTTDSKRYHEPADNRGAFALAHTTNRIAPVGSARIPVWDIAAEGELERETTFASMVAQSPEVS